MRQIDADQADLARPVPGDEGRSLGAAHHGARQMAPVRPAASPGDRLERLDADVYARLLGLRDRALRLLRQRGRMAPPQAWICGPPGNCARCCANWLATASAS